MAKNSLKQVARAAGVSPATVSRVINDAQYVSATTRQKVEQAIELLQYQPSRVARRLRSKEGASQMIGLLVPDIENPFYVDVIRGVEDRAYDQGSGVLLCNFGQSEKKQQFILDMMRDELVDGLILAPVRHDDRRMVDMARSGTPVVCVDHGLSGADVDLVVVDNVEGAFAAVDHLIQLGHRRISYVGGQPQNPTTIDRLHGYQAALAAAKISYDQALVRYGSSSQESGAALTAELLHMPDSPTAIFTGDNLITLGALEAIHRRGLRIPEDVAIVGFDDMNWATSLNPPLTTVSQPGYEMGRRAAELLIQRVAEPNRPYAKVVLETTLMVRRSCGSKA
jgi:DNA-binding LacI/PurR family transcriptional regulator